MAVMREQRVLGRRVTLEKRSGSMFGCSRLRSQGLLTSACRLQVSGPAATDVSPLSSSLQVPLAVVSSKACNMVAVFELAHALVSELSDIASEEDFARSK